MVELDDIYSNRILELAAEIPRSKRLAAPDTTASAQSKLCGSTIAIDLNVRNGEITDFGQTVKACLLGQAAASVVGREIVGTPISEFEAVSQKMRSMLADGSPPPDGRWNDLATLAAVKDYPHRHASTLLVFDAVMTALAQLGLGGNYQVSSSGTEADETAGAA